MIIYIFIFPCVSTDDLSISVQSTAAQLIAPLIMVRIILSFFNVLTKRCGMDILVLHYTKEIDWIDKVETDVHIGKFLLLLAL